MNCRPVFIAPKKSKEQKKIEQKQAKEKKAYEQERQKAIEDHKSKQHPKTVMQMDKNEMMSDRWLKSFRKKKPLRERIKYFFRNLGKIKKAEQGIYSKKQLRQRQKNISKANREREKAKKNKN